MTTGHRKQTDTPEREPGIEEGALGPGGTHMVVEGETPLRLPHERDESSDSGTREPSGKMLLAAQDVEDGLADAPRGPQTQQRYSELTEEAQADGESPDGSARNPPSTQP